MKSRCPTRTTERRQAGYALLTVVFLAAALLITVVAAAPNILTQGRREKEEELVWRGNQYARAVKLYHRKYGRFPQALDDLSKPKNEIRFLRRPYTDPMNTADGSWRLIYVSPTGHLIGSLRQRNVLQLPGSPPSAAGTGQPGMSGGTPTQGSGQNPTGGTGEQSPTQGQQPGQPGSNPADGSDQVLQGPVIGGNIIGVGSKVNKRSIRILDRAENYREWEFIWDPSRDVVPAGQRPAAPTQQPPQQRQQQPPQQQPQQP